MQYEEWMEDGKRNIVKKALEAVSQEGLNPPHHFYMTFRTDYPGVQMASSLKNLYPEEMSISIKEAFWNLHITEDHFSIELLFDQNRELLKIPFKSLVNFIDPGAEFGLQFEWEKNIPESDDSNVLYIDHFRKNH